MKLSEEIIPIFLVSFYSFMKLLIKEIKILGFVLLLCLSSNFSGFRS